MLLEDILLLQYFRTFLFVPLGKKLNKSGEKKKCVLITVLINLYIIKTSGHFCKQFSRALCGNDAQLGTASSRCQPGALGRFTIGI